MRMGIRVTDRVTVSCGAARIDTGVFLAPCNSGRIGTNKQFDDIAIDGLTSLKVETVDQEKVPFGDKETYAM